MDGTPRLTRAARGGWRPPLQLAPHALDRTEALAWVDGDLAAAGIEGLVVKGAASPYWAGERQWLQVKAYETAEVIVGAVTGTLAQPTSVIAGRYTVPGELVIVGRTGAPAHRRTG